MAHSVFVMLLFFPWLLIAVNLCVGFQNVKSQKMEKAAIRALHSRGANGHSYSSNGRVSRYSLVQE